jgi:hypothetical protein
MLLTAAAVQAAIVPGPKGGKLLESGTLRAEFYVNEERQVEIVFYDQDLKPLPPAGPSVVVIAELPAERVRLELEPAEGLLRSGQPLPEGDGYRLVVQIRESTDARPLNFRIDYHAELCGECQRAEYACTCDHAGDEGHGHEH